MRVAYILSGSFFCKLNCNIHVSRLYDSIIAVEWVRLLR